VIRTAQRQISLDLGRSRDPSASQDGAAVTRTLPMLVVEDDPGNRDVLARAFQAEGFTVVSVASGQEAIARATESPPAVVLLDLLLPDLDPLEIVQGVRRAGTNPVVVVVSAAPNVRERSREVGADAFFEKPYDLGELIQTVDHLVPRPVNPRSESDRARDR